MESDGMNTSILDNSDPSKTLLRGINALSIDPQLEQDLPKTENPELDPIRTACLQSQNPVGELIEISQHLAARPPEFSFGDEQGPAHNRQFTCYVKFADFQETGYGKAKKSAKRQAAVKLLYKLKTTEGLLKPSGGGADVAHRNGSANGGIHEMGSRNGPQISKKGTNNNLPNLYQQLRTSQKEYFKKLMAYDVEKGDVGELSKDFLDKISQEEKFDYKIYQKIVKG